MIIHFICSGNTNRSRMAEAYFNSKKLAGFKATSSGVKAIDNLNGDITPFAKAILEKNNLLNYTAPTWQLTTVDILKKVDLVIFMKQMHFDFVKNNLGFIPKNYLIWNIEDVETDQADKINDTLLERVAEDEIIFNDIKKNVDQLIIGLRRFV